MDEIVYPREERLRPNGCVHQPFNHGTAWTCPGVCWLRWDGPVAGEFYLISQFWDNEEVRKSYYRNWDITNYWPDTELTRELENLYYMVI